MTRAVQDRVEDGCGTTYLEAERAGCVLFHRDICKRNGGRGATTALVIPEESYQRNSFEGFTDRGAEVLFAGQFPNAYELKAAKLLLLALTLDSVRKRRLVRHPQLFMFPTEMYLAHIVHLCLSWMTSV